MGAKQIIFYIALLVCFYQAGALQTEGEGNEVVQIQSRSSRFKDRILRRNQPPTAGQLQPSKEGQTGTTEVTEGSLIDIISSYEEANPQLTQLPQNEDPLPLIPEDWQGKAGLAEYKEKARIYKDNFINTNMPEKTVDEHRKDLRLLAGRTLVLVKQMLQEANSDTEDVQYLAKRSWQIRNQLRKLGSMNSFEVNQLIAVQLTKIEGVARKVSAHPVVVNTNKFLDKTPILGHAKRGIANRVRGFRRNSSPPQVQQSDTQDATAQVVPQNENVTP